MKQQSKKRLAQESVSETTVAVTDDVQSGTAETVGISEAAPEQTPPYTNVVLNEADSEAITAAQNNPETSSDNNGTIDSTVLSASPEELAIARETERAAQLLASLESGAVPEAVEARCGRNATNAGRAGQRTPQRLG